VTRPRLLTRRPYRGKYRQYRCALCYQRLWPWQATCRGANYFPHPYMRVHSYCGWYYAREMAAVRAAGGD
jgi:hypothetical protein